MSRTKSQPPSSQPPQYVSHQNREWSRTGKTRTHLRTDANGAVGEIHHEYEEIDDAGTRTGARLWRNPSGHLYSED